MSKNLLPALLLCLALSLTARAGNTNNPGSPEPPEEPPPATQVAPEPDPLAALALELLTSLASLL